MTIEEFLDSAFPEGKENSIEWLCHCLSQSQIALIVGMLKLNADEGLGETGAYAERAQRLFKVLKEIDSDWQKYLEPAERLVREHKLY